MRCGGIGLKSVQQSLRVMEELQQTNCPEEPSYETCLLYVTMALCRNQLYIKSTVGQSVKVRAFHVL